MLAFTDDVSRANAVISGQIDFAHEIEHSQYPVVKDNKAVVVANYKTATVYTINMNITTEPFIGATSDIRQACRFAADRQQYRSIRSSLGWRDRKRPDVSVGSLLRIGHPAACV